MTGYLFGILLGIFLVTPAIVSLFGRRSTYEQEERNHGKDGDS